MKLLHHCTRAGAPRRPWSTLRRLASGPLALLLCLCATVTVTASAASVASAAAGVTVVSAAPARHPTGVAPSQQLAVLNYEHRAYRAPSTRAPRRASIPGRRPITGEPTTLPVLAQTTDRHGQSWLKVLVPGRPNSSTAWIQRAGTYAQVTTWNIHVSLARRHVWIYHRGRLVRDFSAVVGKPSTPTPTGHFFVEETVIMPASEAGGPYALALSGRSDVLHQFAGGPGEIAIHGRDSLGGTPGRAQSHGCIRLTTANITWLIARIGPGTPVTIE